MESKRLLGPVLAVILAVGIGGAVLVSHNRKVAVESVRAAAASIVDVKGMIGSEKESFFTDPKVIELLAAKGLRVTFEKVGSREIATRDLKGYDFGFPAGTPAAIFKRQVKSASGLAKGCAAPWRVRESRSRVDTV